MLNQKNNPSLLVGAAIAAGIIGTLRSLLGYRKKNSDWSKQAKSFANQVLASKDVLNKRMVLGGVAGGLIGATAALLMAPKSGSELLKDIARTFSRAREKGRSVQRKDMTAPKKGPSRSVKSRKASSPLSVSKKHPSTAKKKSSSPPKHRAAPRPLHHEKIEHSPERTHHHEMRTHH